MDAQLVDDNRRLRTGIKPAFVDITTQVVQEEADDLAWIDEIDFTRPAPGTHLGRMLGRVVGSAMGADDPSAA